MYVEISSASTPPRILKDGEPWQCVFVRSPWNPDQRTEKRGADMAGGPPDIPMARRRCARLRWTLVVDVDDEGSVNDEDEDEYANADLALWRIHWKRGCRASRRRPQRGNGTRRVIFVVNDRAVVAAFRYWPISGEFYLNPLDRELIVPILEMRGIS